ncbi:MAG: GNAT family N-acetyltransferase [Acidobacteriota bacterium]
MPRRPAEAASSVTGVRRFEPADANATAQVWLRAGLDEYSYLPEFQELDRISVLPVFQELIADPCRIWVYEAAGSVCGFVSIRGGSTVDRLYVDPAWQRRGAGSALLEHAKRLSPGGLELHTHQQNLRALAFYEKAGFVPVRWGISPPPECVPDVELHWRPFGDAP